MIRYLTALLFLFPVLAKAGQDLYERDSTVVTINLAAAQAIADTVSEQFDDAALGLGVFFHHNRQRYWGYGFGYQHYGETEGQLSGILEGEGPYTGEGELKLMGLEAYANLRMSISARWNMTLGAGVAYVTSDWVVETDQHSYKRSDSEFAPMVVLTFARPMTSYMGLDISAKRIEADAIDISVLTVGYSLKF